MIPSLKNVLWPSFIGGILWLLHFLVIYALGEFGCVTGVKWAIPAIVAVTIPPFIVTLWGAYRCHLFSQRDFPNSTQTMARIGLINNIIFAFAIIVQVLPVLLFQGKCL